MQATSNTLVPRTQSELGQPCVSERHVTEAHSRWVTQDTRAACLDGMRIVLAERDAERADLLDALRAVVVVADRKTDEFDRARALIARAEANHVR